MFWSKAVVACEHCRVVRDHLPSFAGLDEAFFEWGRICTTSRSEGFHSASSINDSQTLRMVSERYRVKASAGSGDCRCDSPSSPASPGNRENRTPLPHSKPSEPQPATQEVLVNRSQCQSFGCSQINHERLVFDGIPRLNDNWATVSCDGRTIY